MVKCEKWNWANLTLQDEENRSIPNSEFTLEIDMLIVAIGTKPNPLVGNTTKGVELKRKWNYH